MSTQATTGAPARLTLPDGRVSVEGALFDRTGAYRYLLWRTLRESGPTVLFVMLNPSTAGPERDDPTIRACIRHARRRRTGFMLVANLYALRSTDPRGLRKHLDPVGPENDAHLAAAAARADRIIAAWGDAGPRDVDDRAAAALAGPLAGGRLACLGVTRAGRPKHPLYLPTATRLRPYTPGSAVASSHVRTARARISA